MCGFYVLFDFNESKINKNIDVISNQLNHRGPDNTGFWSNKSSIKMLHKRLSIIDNSESSNQPIHSENQQYVMVFNGEIYNYQELNSFISSSANYASDTQVLIELWSKLGKKCLSLLEGMYSFVIYDKKNKEIFCIRDPFGIKPIYYTLNKNILEICSEISPIIDGKKFNLRSVNAYLSSEYYENIKETFYKNVYKVKPGHIVIYGKEGIQEIEYQSQKNLIELKNSIKSDKKDQLYELCQECFNLGTTADVDLTVSTSGGLDSSIINYFVSLNKEKISKNVSFIFDNQNYSEEKFIDISSRGTGIPLQKKTITIKDFINNYEKCSISQFEPHAGLPVISYYDCLKNCNSTKVVLDGSGIDELHLGYTKYIQEQKSSNNLYGQDGSKSVFSDIMGKKLKEYDNFDHELYTEFEEEYKNMQFNDLFFIKLPRALRFRDRLSMASSIELRPIFLNKKLASFLFNLNFDDHVKDGLNKFLLRKTFQNKIDNEILWINKRQVQTPQVDWFRNELKEWVFEKIKKSILWDTGWINHEVFMKKVDIFNQKKINNSFFIWKFLNLELMLKN